MKIKIELWGQLKQAAGQPEFELEVADGATVQDAVGQLAGDALKAVLLDGDGLLCESNLVFVDGNQIRPSDVLMDGSTITLMSPIAGG